MLRLALKSVKHNPLRLLLTAIAVALGVILVSATLTITNALQSNFNALFEDIYSSSDVIAEADPAAAAEESDDPFAAQEGLFGPADVDAIAAIDGVEYAAGTTQVSATILDKDADPQQTPFGPAGGQSQIYNWTGNPVTDLSTITEGRGPEADDQIVLDYDSADLLHYEIGDQVRMATETGIQTFELVGLVSFGDDNALQGATLAYVTTQAAWDITGSDTFGTVSVIAAPGENLDELAQRVQEVLPDGARAITGEQKVKEAQAAVGDVLKWIDIITIAFALIALFVGTFIIANTFRIIVTQRTRELGLMRAIGVTGRQVRTMIILEAVVVGVIAGTAGVLIGYLLGLGLVFLVETFGPGNIFGTVTLPLDAVLLGYGLAISVTVVSAILPAIHASRVSPMAALRDAATESRKPLGMRNIVGGALTIAAISLITIGLNVTVPRPYIWVAVGATVLILGITLLAAQVLVPLAFGLRGALTQLFGVTGKLAANNIKREPRRSANTAAALMIGVMLLSFVATFTESMKSQFTEQFRRIDADLFVLSGQGPIPQGAIDTIAGVDGVEAVARFSVGTALIDGEDYSLGIVDADLADRAFDYDNDPDFSELNGGVYIDPVMQDLGYAVGDTITVEGPEGTLDLVVTGLYLVEGDANLWVDWPTGERLVGEPVIFQGMVLAEVNDPDVAALQESVTEALNVDFPLVGVTQPDAFQKLANDLINLILGIISALLGAALVVAIVGVANTLLLSVTERTREVGLIRAVGASRLSVGAMVTIESIVMSIFGTILGMILGVSLGVALIRSLSEFGFTSVAIPWFWLILYTLGALLAGVVASVWPAIKAARMDILKAIAADG